MATESWQVYIVREMLGLKSVPVLRERDVYMHSTKEMPALKTESYDGLWLSWENMHLQAQQIRASWTQTKTQTKVFEREKLANDSNNKNNNADNGISLRHSRHLVDQKHD